MKSQRACMAASLLIGVPTTWYDTWRIRDGKADEHWDAAVKSESPDVISH